MKEKFLKALKDLFPSVKADILDRVAEAFASTATDDNLETITKSDGVKNLINHFQVEGDKRATEAGKTAVKTFRDKHNLDEEGKPVEKKKPEENPNDIQTIVANAVKAAVEPLQQKLEGYEKRGTQEALQQEVLTKVREGLKTDTEKKGFDAWVKGRSIEIDSKDKLDEVSGSISTSFSEYRQEMIDQGVITDVPPDGGGGENFETDLDNWSRSDEKE